VLVLLLVLTPLLQGAGDSDEDGDAGMQRRDSSGGAASGGAGGLTNGSASGYAKWMGLVKVR